MGGSIETGNSTTYTEYNISSDPDAAKKVLTNTEIAPRTMLVPLDVTHTALATKKVLSIIKGGDGAPSIRQMLYELLKFVSSTNKKELDIDNGAPVHDPLATASLIQLYGINDEINLVYTRYELDVILRGEERQGQTVLVKLSENGVMVLKKANIDKFWECIYEALDNACKHVIEK